MKNYFYKMQLLQKKIYLYVEIRNKTVNFIMLLHCDCNILVIGVFCLADRRFDYIGSFSQNLTNLM